MRTRNSPCAAMWSSDLRLEEVVEPAADVARPRRIGRRVALDRHAQREAVALVLRVLVRHALDDRLRALEAAAGGEVRALAARGDGGGPARHRRPPRPGW